jgi:methionyl-tRNA synthetase
MITFEEFQKLDLRIARITEAANHPNADKLIVMKIDVGGVEKQIVAGLRQYYKSEDLVGRKVVVVNNLAPAKLRGIESNGMLLAADTGSNVVILTPEKDVPVGSKVR